MPPRLRARSGPRAWRPCDPRSLSARSSFSRYGYPMRKIQA